MPRESKPEPEEQEVVVDSMEMDYSGHGGSFTFDLTTGQCVLVHQTKPSTTI